MTRVRLVDGTNVVRRKLESGGRVLREVFTESQQTPADVVSIWCWEGIDSKKPRRALYPNYKLDRVQVPDGTYETMRTVGEVLAHTRALQVQVREREADDCIAALAAQLSRDPGVREVLILSNDRDFGQLCVLPKVRVEFEHKTDPDLVRLYKATVGDPSDGIKGLRLFGPKAWDGVIDKDSFRDRLLGFSAGEQHHHFPEVSAATLAWMLANRPVIRAMWDVVGFLPIADDVLDQSTTVGVEDAAAAAAIIGRFMQ